MPTIREQKERQRTMILLNVPPGTILLWPQAKPIPIGFQKCDGTNGTVNIPIVVAGVAIYIQKLLAKELTP